ncbi:protein GbcA [Pseudomonas aylmerensis]|uniref:Protein GbcA n=1 Tax=Pseudomonas aylmerensis TaxID=1869229 RepID=A0A2T4FSX8_9PSED|nr:protein GbcA [Pseudomonas aylmerensis]
MVAILRNARTTHLPICDIHILIATSPHTTGVARRDQSGPCRSWIRFRASAAPHSLPTTTLSLRLAQQQP